MRHRMPEGSTDTGCPDGGLEPNGHRMGARQGRRTVRVEDMPALDRGPLTLMEQDGLAFSSHGWAEC